MGHLQEPDDGAHNGIFSRAVSRRVGVCLLVLLLLGGLLPSNAFGQATPAPDYYDHVGPNPDLVCPRGPQGARTLEAVEQLAPNTGKPLPAPNDIAAGVAADETVTADILALEQMYAGCFNDADFPRLFALMTDELVADWTRLGYANRWFLGAGDTGLIYDLFSVVDQKIMRIDVQDVRRLADRQAVATVGWRVAHCIEPDCWEYTRHVYQQVDGRWLLAGELPLDLPTSGEWPLEDDDASVDLVLPAADGETLTVHAYASLGDVVVMPAKCHGLTVTQTVKTVTVQARCTKQGGVDAAEMRLFVASSFESRRRPIELCEAIEPLILVQDVSCTVKTTLARRGSHDQTGPRSAREPKVRHFYWSSVAVSSNGTVTESTGVCRIVRGRQNIPPPDDGKPPSVRIQPCSDPSDATSRAPDPG